MAKFLYKTEKPEEITHYKINQKQKAANTIGVWHKLWARGESERRGGRRGREG